MTNKIKLLAGSMLVASFILSPVMSFADQGKNSEKKAVKTEIKINKEERNENKNEQNCLKVFAHLVGGKDWKNQNGVSLSNCWLPFGIGKKLNSQASTTLDTTAPVISNIQVVPQAQKARITWKTDEKTSNEIFFGTSTPVSLSGGMTVKTGLFKGMEKDSSVVLNKLSPNTTYYFIVRSKDRAGNVATSTVQSFTTLSASADLKAPVIMDVVTVKATSTIQVGWKTNEPSKSVVYYGTVNPINLSATSTLRISDASLQTNHLLVLPNLTPNTNYNVVIEASDANNNKSTTTQFSITTNL